MEDFLMNNAPRSVPICNRRRRNKCVDVVMAAERGKRVHICSIVVHDRYMRCTKQPSGHL